MSLAINPDTVTAVLLADGWHEVHDKSTLVIDSYEYMNDEAIYHRGGESGICATGFRFVEHGHHDEIAGPLTAILAVRTI